MPYHNIEATIDASLQSDLLERLRSIGEQLPFLVNLTAKERRSGGMLTHNNYSFTEATLDYATHNATLLPPSFSLAAWQSDVDLYNKLSPIIQRSYLKPCKIPTSRCAWKAKRQPSIFWH